ncbi:MAG TPA: acyl-CoA thioester hydrolase/BAAT C-terminal domain-containing protein [Puia sp.]|nr:acyl-CoA thioester hydrolase/BAAT C-terminal domain-containing protein [Puia sp.]
MRNDVELFQEAETKKQIDGPLARLAKHEINPKTNASAHTKKIMDYQFNKEVNIPVKGARLSGQLSIPFGSRGVIIFSHGSGSSRKSPRNQYVAERLEEKKIGTLLFDLLTLPEASQYENRFDIDLLSTRLAGATEWLLGLSEMQHSNIGFFGASTGAASALKVASFMPEIQAVVSRGGRPDLVMDDLPNVLAPTLLIVGSLDHNVLKLNRQAYSQLGGVKSLEIIEGATHLFEERGMIEKVTELAADWFTKYLQPVPVIRKHIL